MLIVKFDVIILLWVLQDRYDISGSWILADSAFNSGLHMPVLVEWFVESKMFEGHYCRYH